MTTESGTHLVDTIVYERTIAGQEALLSAMRELPRLERRFLGAVTGYTSLRVLMDLGFDERGFAQAIARLIEKGLIAAVRQE